MKKTTCNVILTICATLILGMSVMAGSSVIPKQQDSVIIQVDKNRTTLPYAKTSGEKGEAVDQEDVVYGVDVVIQYADKTVANEWGYEILEDPAVPLASEDPHNK